jgi:hypothetical protein
MPAFPPLPVPPFPREVASFEPLHARAATARHTNPSLKILITEKYSITETDGGVVVTYLTRSGA